MQAVYPLFPLPHTNLFMARKERHDLCRNCASFDRKLMDPIYGVIEKPCHVEHIRIIVTLKTIICKKYFHLKTHQVLYWQAFEICKCQIFGQKNFLAAYSFLQYMT